MRSQRRGPGHRGIGARRRGQAVASPLSRFPPFDRCRPKVLAPLAAHVDQVCVAEGTVLAHEGWVVREVVMVLAGEVVARHDDRELQRYGPGTQIGATELLGGASHPATLVAGAGLDVLVVYGPAYRWAAQTVLSADA